MIKITLGNYKDTKKLCLSNRIVFDILEQIYEGKTNGKSFGDDHIARWTSALYRADKTISVEVPLVCMGAKFCNTIKTASKNKIKQLDDLVLRYMDSWEKNKELYDIVMKAMSHIEEGDL